MAKYNDLTVAMLTPTAYTVLTVPPASAHKGSLIYVSNGAAGQPTLAFSDGTNWKIVSATVNIS
jgi:hypothetical protein